MPEPIEKRFFTISEYALITGDSVSTVRRAIRAGDLPFQQRGPKKKIKIPREALNTAAPSNDEQIPADGPTQVPIEKQKAIPGPKSKIWKRQCQRNDKQS